MPQAKLPDQPMDLNVIVAGGTREDRNLLTTLIADILHQAGFDDVKRELVGEVDQTTLSVLDVIKDTRPHLFTETVHVTAVADVGAFITENDGALESTGPRMLMTVSSTNQPLFEPQDIDEDDTTGGDSSSPWNESRTALTDAEGPDADE